jgi:hypothetical protein
MRNTEESRRSAQTQAALGASRVAVRTGLLLLILALSVLVSGERRSELSRAFPYALTDRQRYGFVATSATWREDFDVSPLRGGWYVDVNPPACAISVDGMDRAILVRVRTWMTEPRFSWLESMVDSHPGSLWLVGNEPDCIWQDNLLPEDYADVYHQIYTAIKGWDDTALVSPGGIVQATPLRLQWLDLVLQSYADMHDGAKMPVDVWNIHNAIVNEVNPDCFPEDAWGADIPPGIDACEGLRLTMNDNDDTDIFRQQIWDFRAWMADRGYAGYPLIVSEFGVLMPLQPRDRVSDFMDATFQFLANTTDPVLGDPNDGYRLVQRWAWFSLDNPPYDINDPQAGMYNGNLFDPYTTEITDFGLNFASHTNDLPSLGYIELRPGRLRFEPLEPVGPGEFVTRKVYVEVQNLGSLAAGPFWVGLEYEGPVSGQLQRPVAGMAGDSTAWIEFELTQLSAGAYSISVSVDADDQVPEITECDNWLASPMVVPTDLAYLPLIAR